MINFRITIKSNIQFFFQKHKNKNLIIGLPKIISDVGKTKIIELLFPLCLNKIIFEDTIALKIHIYLKFLCVNSFQYKNI